MAVRAFSLMDISGINPQVLTRIFEKTAGMMREQTAGLVNLLAETARDLWRGYAESMAQKEGWGKKYAEAIKTDPAVPGSGAVTAAVYANAGMAMYINLVQNGVKTWSIKDALLKGKAAQRNEDKYGVRFVRVPFRWHTPVKKGQGKPSSIFTGVMPRDIYNKVRSGVRLRGEEYGRMSGLTRVGKPLHYQYFTWRTVSAKSKGWQYPDVPGTDVYGKVLERLEKLIPMVLKDYITGLLPDLKKEVRA